MFYAACLNGPYTLKFNSWPGRGKRRPCCTSRWRREAWRRAEGSRSKREGRMRTEPWTLSAQLLRAGIRYLVRSASARDPFRWARCGRRRGCWPRCLWPTPGEERWLHLGECFGYFFKLTLFEDCSENSPIWSHWSARIEGKNANQELGTGNFRQWIFRPSAEKALGRAWS